MPSFLVLGAQKAGTTALHEWLLRQASVSLPAIKETHFFSSDAQFAKGVQWYLRQFSDRGAVSLVGEVASDYLFVEQAAFRIRELLPDCRLVVVFREPLARAFSHYLMSVRKGYETLSFGEALARENERLEDDRGRRFFSYLSRGLYVEQVRRYLELFPRAHLLFVKFDDLVDGGACGRDTCRMIAEFIGLDSRADTLGVLMQANQASRPRFKLVRDVLYGNYGFKRVLRVLLPSRDLRALIAHRLDLFNLRPEPKPEMGPVPGAVVRRVVEEVENLQQLTGMDFGDWLAQIDAYEQC